MSDQMPYVPYIPPEEGISKRFEMTIPILLLILVVAVVAWKLGWFGGLFGGGVLNIAIIGDDAVLQKTLSDLKPEVGAMNIKVFKASELADKRDSHIFDGYNLLILTEGADGDTVALPSLVLDFVKEYAKSGRTVLMYGQAATQVVSSPSERGWSRLEFVPVECKSSTCESETATSERIKLTCANEKHKILKDFSCPLSFPENKEVPYTLINPRQDAKADVLIHLEVRTGTANDTTTPTEALVIREGAPIFGGKLVYFAYHPSYYPQLMRSVLKYIK